MIKYALVEDEKTKICSVGIGTDEEYYKSIGFTLQDVDQAYDGSWYLKGYAPEKPKEVKKQEVRAVRNKYLEQTDKYMSVSDFPIDDNTKEQYRLYRQYLRDYTKEEEWYEHNPMTFEEWRGQ